MNYKEATDEIKGIAKKYWDSSSLNILGLATPAEVRWNGNPVGSTPPQDAYYAVASYQTVIEGQAGMVDANSNQPRESQGLFYFQIFCPKTRRDAVPKGLSVAQAVQQAFCKQSSSANVWFRNQTVREIGFTGDHYQINVVVTCQYTNTITVDDFEAADSLAVVTKAYKGSSASILSEIEAVANQ